MEGYWRTAQAAAELEISPHHMRKLCEANLLEAERTEGGQWRIPMQEVERLKKAGVPPIPVIAESEAKAKAPRQNGSATLLGLPSAAVVGSAEEAVIAENELRTRHNKVERLKLRKEATQIGDFFRARKQSEANEEAARRRQEQEEQAERDREARQQQAAQRRREWTDEKIAYALRQKPYDAPDAFRLAILEQVQQCLTKLDPTQPDYITEQLIDAAVEKALEPWNRTRAKERAIETALWRLDIFMKTDPVWKLRAQEAAAEAIERLRPDANQSEMETAGRAAVQPLIAEFEHLGRYRKIVETTWYKLDNPTTEEREDAKDAVRLALDALPIGASDRQFEQARDTALLPIQERIAARQDEATRQAAIDSATSNLPWRISDQLKQRTVTLLREAVDGLPAGTPRTELDRACARIVGAATKAHERHQKKQGLIDDGLREVFPYLLKLKDKYELPKSAVTLEAEFREPIRKALSEELDGKEIPPHRIIGIVRELVREELGIE